MDELKQLFETALKEDAAERDVTSLSCLPDNQQGCAYLIAKEAAVIAGLSFLPSLFQMLDPLVSMKLHYEEGARAPQKAVLATLEGAIQPILAAERTALNLLQHLSGIATLTQRYVQEIQGLSCDILDTRKTLPSLRSLQKYAVKMGGGKNHRFTLAEQVLIKDRHLRFVSIAEAVSRSRSGAPGLKIEVEVETLEQCEEALDCGVDAILLDNMSLDLVEKAVRLNRGRVYLEASGNMTLETIRPYAATGVNGISVGALTHSVKAIDISLKFKGGNIYGIGT